MRLLKSLKIINFQINFFILLGLIVLGSSFLVAAQNSGNSSKNIFLDSDQDGLSDDEEKTYGTDPRNKDTDNDGYSDGVEVKSGYDPLKPAPGDKIMPERSFSSKTGAEEDNLTQKLAKNIVAISKKSEADGNPIDAESIQSLIDQSMGSMTDENIEEEAGDTELSQEELVISPDQLKIKKQNYSKYSEEKQKEKRKEDMIEYLSGMYYIFSSNSPEPLTSGTSFSSVIESSTNKIIQTFTTRNTAKVAALKSSGEKIFEQTKEIEVPEEMVDTHINAMTFAKSAIDMETYLNPNPADPIKDIQNLSKIEGLLSNVMSFTSQVETKLSEYDIDFNNDIGKKVEEMGTENIFSN